MVKNFKFIVGISLLIVILLVGSIYFGKSIQSDTSPKNNIVNYHGDYPSYENQSEMENASDIIISGKILNSSVKTINIKVPSNSYDPQKNPGKDGKNTADDENLVYTVSKVMVGVVYKGQNIKSGDIIEVKQLGGLVNNVLYKEENTNPFNNNKEYVMFLKEYENGIPYSLINPIQGSYENNNDNYKENSDNKVKLDIQSLKKLKGK